VRVWSAMISAEGNGARRLQPRVMERDGFSRAF